MTTFLASWAFVATFALFWSAYKQGETIEALEFGIEFLHMKILRLEGKEEDDEECTI
jgi:hypothetical protein